MTSPQGGNSTPDVTSAPAGARLNVFVLSHLFPPQDASSAAGIFVREQLEALSAIADVTCMVPRPGLTARRELPTLRPGLRVIEVPLPALAFLPGPLRVLAWIRPYRRQALEAARTAPRAFDVLHAHFGLPDGAAGVSTARRLALPSVVTLHGSDFNHQFSRPGIGRWFGRRITRASAVIAVSEAIASGMRGRYPDAASRVHHLSNGYNSAEITSQPRHASQHFLFAGSLIPRKNPDVLIRAYAHIVGETALDLVIVGDGPLRPALETLAADLRIADRVRFEGQRPHAALDAYLADAAALVLPSSSEGMPMVVNEALASGTPVVASRLPGIEQQVRSEAFGILVPPGDETALADALLRAAVTNWDHATIAATCGVHSWDDYAHDLVALYRSVITPR